MRKRVKGIHVAYHIESTQFNDEYEPLEEGLDKVTIKRLVATLKASITLTKGDDLKKLPGYMPPLADSDLLGEEKFKEEVQNHFSKEHT